MGFACNIDGRMDGELYTKILQDEIQESLAFYGKDPSAAIFQQDNYPKHKSKLAMTWLEDHGFKVLLWPAQSPDLNPIEHLWEHLKRRLGEYDRAPSGILELWERVQVEWDNIQCITKPFQCLSRLDLLAYISTRENRKIMKILYNIVLLLSF